MEEKKCKIICLTPVKNEEWIIGKFLKAASIWADSIIISDQGSTDDTVKIASQFPKVTIIDNSKLLEYNEKEYRLPLYNEARKLPGKKLLIQLDVDEFLTPNFDDLEWKTMMEAPIGTRFLFNWYNIQTNMNSYFVEDNKPFAFMDDGSEYDSGIIHCPRIPLRRDVPYVKLNSINVLHFQFVNWDRMELKHMWYRMYEKVIHPRKSIIQIWREYHYEKNRPIDNINVFALPREYLDGYNKYGIELTSVLKVPEKHWDNRMVDYIVRYGWKRFKRVDVDKNYIRQIDHHEVLKSQKLKYNAIDLLIINYLKRTQRNKNKIYIKVIDLLLMPFF